MTKSSTYASIIFLIFLASCAQIVPLGGGKKDVAGPVAKVYAPENKSIGFKGKEIRIAYDEYIILREAASQLQVNPLPDEPAEITGSNKELKIRFNQNLKPNTTYHISWANAVTDLHEGNASEFNEYVFSTGEVLDTFSISGKVWSDEKLNYRDIRVNLYDQLIDSLPYIKKPLYSVRVDEQGNFRIPYIKEQKYSIVSIEDKNKNYVYEQGEEKIGWTNGTNTIQLFSEMPYRGFVKKSNEIGAGQTMVLFNREIQNIQVRDEFNNTLFKSELATDTLWIYNLWKDSLEHRFVLYENESAFDTLRLFSNDSKKWNSDEKANRLKPTIKTKSNSFPTNKSIQLNFQHPVKLINKKQLRLSDSTGQAMVLNLEPLVSEGLMMIDSMNYCKSWQITSSFNFNNKYRLEILPGAFESYFRKANDTLIYEFQNQVAENFGTLSVQLKLPENNPHLFELIAPNGAVAYFKAIENTTNKSILITGLIPGEYKMRLTQDTNNDKKYTNGDYLKKILPEKRIYFSQPIRVLADWEIEQEWNALSDWNEK